MVLETKSDISFSVSQVLIDGYTPPFTLHRDNNGGDIMFFVRQNTSCKLMSAEDHPMEGF